MKRLLVALLVFVPACDDEKSLKPIPATLSPKADSGPTTTARRPSGPAAAIAHAGVGTPPKMADGCRAAVDAALQVLDQDDADPLEAAVKGVSVMEDDPRFNAGTGSKVRIDGEPVQMDAAVMES